MDTHTQTESNDVSKNHRRPYLKRFGVLTLLIVVLVLVGAVYESIAESSDVRAYPPPGRLIDVGGYRLHINCTGVGSPTVVIEAGWGDSSTSWGWVQPEVAKTTRICTYDRAGTGWSESSSQPRTAREFANELHTLLEKAKEPGPYVLVGHSLGAYTIRVYAHDYSSEVAGLVFTDPQNLSNSDVSTLNPAPKPGKNSVPMLMARIGLVRLLAGPLGSVQDLPAKDRQAHTATSVTPRFVQTFLDEGMGMSEGASQARAVTSFGDLPIIVLSRGKDMDAESAASQARYLKLSTNNNSQHMVADRSDHRIMIEQPDAAVGAIVKMVEMVRLKAKN